MNMPRIARLEREITQLPSDEQRWLVDRVSRRLRESRVTRDENDDRSLAAMAADPEVIRELRRIGEDFRPTESDGLENT
jgi:hypothetical protein